MNDPVLSLPTKCVLDHRQRIRQIPKPNTEFVTDNGESILKVKLAGISFFRDFELCKILPGRSVVPGNKIVGKIYKTLNPNIPMGKYIVFPYSTCQLERASKLCKNCIIREMKGVAPDVDYGNYDAFSHYPCINSWEYGLSIDGGLQDYVKVKSSSSLIRIPENISSHDCCFLFDIALPFYVFIKESLLKPHGDKKGNILEKNLLIALHDKKKETNDILIVMKHFGINQANVKFIDAKEQLCSNRKFSYAFVFNCSLIETTAELLSTGLECTRSRYNLIIFDQYDPESLLNHKKLERNYPDLTISHFSMHYKDKVNTIELINIIANMNAGLIKEKDSTNTNNNSSHSDISRTSVFSADKTVNTSSSHSESLSNPSTSSGFEKKPKTVRFKEDEFLNVSGGNRRHPKVYSWFWYDKDYMLYEDELYKSEDESETHHSFSQINEALQKRKYTRVCYAKKQKSVKNFNAFVLN